MKSARLAHPFYFALFFLRWFEFFFRFFFLFVILAFYSPFILYVCRSSVFLPIVLAPARIFAIELQQKGQAQGIVFDIFLAFFFFFAFCWRCFVCHPFGFAFFSIVCFSMFVSRTMVQLRWGIFCGSLNDYDTMLVRGLLYPSGGC